MPADLSLAERVRRGDPRALARAISLVEDGAPDGEQLIRDLYRDTGRGRLIGVTGPPGAGKSTLVDGLTSAIRNDGLSVGVIAVDPSSPFTGGAVLGDRVRMAGQAADSGVFIRSMATRGHLGGLADATADAALILDAAGKHTIILETVGVGQGEVEIASEADATVLILVPGAGDDVQALKAGVMEIADIFVVNKADREGADRLAQAIAASLALKEPQHGSWQPPILKTIATENVGIAELSSALRDFLAHSSTDTAARRRNRDEHRLRRLLTQHLLRQTQSRIPDDAWDALVDAVTSRRLDPYSAVARILAREAVPRPDAARQA